MKSSKPDYFLIGIIFSLILSGLIVLSSASTVLSNELFGSSYYFLKHQVFFALFAGIAVFLVFQKIDYRFWKKFSLPALIFSLFLLGLVLVPSLGYSHGGAQRWLDFKFASIQPFEVVKLSLIFYLAALLSKKGKKEEIIKQSLVPFIVISSMIGLLVLMQPDLSSLLMVALIGGILYFLAEVKVRHLLVVGLLLIGLFFILIKAEPYRMSRWTVFMHPEIEPQGIGYQINQALLAVGSGGIFGLGYGNSVQKWKYLPEPIGDSVYAIIGEEWGLVGATIILILLFLFLWKGFRVAARSPDRFGYLLAGGISGWLFFQSFINIMAILGLAPITGTPLPFISYGGSSLIVALAASGILINISKYTKG